MHDGHRDRHVGRDDGRPERFLEIVLDVVQADHAVQLAIRVDDVDKNPAALPGTS